MAGRRIINTDSQWKAQCEKDAITDKVLCYAYHKNLWVFLHEAGEPSISVGGDTYPGSQVWLRFVGEKPYMTNDKGSFTKTESKWIIKKLQDGATVSTQYKDWPYNVNRTETIEVYGFREAYKYLQWAIKHID